MSLWMLTPVRGGRVAIRIRHVDDRARRVTHDRDDPGEIREQWRCSGCSAWLDGVDVTFVESGRAVAGAPEVALYCGSCIGRAQSPKAV